MDIPTTQPEQYHNKAAHHPRNGQRPHRLPPGLLGWIVLGSVIATGIALRAATLTTYQHDYDEGVYWSSLRAMLQGHPLFTQVFSSQPPLFLLAIYPFFTAFGQTIWAARLGVLIFSVMIMAILYGLGRTIGGRLCGLVAVILFAMDPLARQQSQSLEAEIPALAFGLLALLIAYSARRFGGKAALAAGIAFGLSLTIKIITPPIAVPIVLVFLAAAVERANAQIRQIWGTAWPTHALSASANDIARPLAGLLALFAAGTALGIALVIAPFIGNWRALYNQVVLFHLRAATNAYPGHLQIFSSVPSEYLLDSAAILSALLALRRRQWQAIPLIAWYAASIVYLLKLTPLFPHHLVILVPVASLLVGILFAPAQRPTITLPRIVCAGASYPASRRQLLSTLSALLLLIIIGFSLGHDINAIYGEVTSHHTLILREAQDIDRLTAPDTLVLTDDQFIAALANRDVPPTLVDTSAVRIQSGYLTATQLIAAARDPQVGAILFSSGRFREVPGFIQWTQQHLRLVHDYGDGVQLYAPSIRPINSAARLTARQ
jgi:4-amino-4-deoxy-L-arabinose transferase-like glycosyltransferase